MKRILFVDDEPAVLAGLRDLLWRRRRDWDMVFALGGEAALEYLRTSRFDVLVTDVRMPRLDGPSLLVRAQESNPEVARIVLSGYVDEEATLRALPVAHQFLTKPCDASLLENTIERACSIQALIVDRKLREFVGQISSLPSRPAVYSTLVSRLAKDTTSAREVAEVLEQDLALSAKLLQIVNSAFFALPRRITRIEDAVAYLGFRAIRDMTLSASVFGTAAETRGVSLESLQRHALLVGGLARRVVKDRHQADDALAAGMLHDIGILILASRLPNRLERTIGKLREKPALLRDVERELWGVTHADLGAYLLGLWGLPYPIVEAVAYHHHPTVVPQRGLDVLAAVHIADSLVREATGDHCGIEGAKVSPIDSAYLESIGAIDSLEDWRELAREFASAPAAGA